jgi:hypothetical protein
MILGGRIKAWHIVLACVALTQILPPRAWADSPLPMPEAFTVCSSDKQTCAASDPKAQLTSITHKPSKSRWQIQGWHRAIYLANDGQSLVIGYSGINLVPIDVDLKQTILSFYKHEQLIRKVPLNEFYQKRSQMPKTASHRAWGYVQGFNEKNELQVNLEDGRRLFYSAKTGTLVRTEQP